MSKYGARRSLYAGEVYASQAEANYAAHLDLLRAAGEIQAWGRAESIELIPGKRSQRIDYRPDFFVYDRDGQRHYVEVKGAETPVWKLKRRLLKHLRPDIRLLVVYRDREEWV